MEYRKTATDDESQRKKSRAGRGEPLSQNQLVSHPEIRKPTRPGSPSRRKPVGKKRDAHGIGVEKIQNGGERTREEGTGWDKEKEQGTLIGKNLSLRKKGFSLYSQERICAAKRECDGE